jgi:3(or 17)beta-hydroxysteroid dehydrogenase
VEGALNVSRLESKVVIVTGAASGLGAADARLLTKHGARVVMTDIDEIAGRALADQIGADFVRQDVVEEAGWVALIADVVRRHGRLDGLVNNAGIAPIANIETTSTEVWRKTLAVHLDATFFGCKHAIAAMKTTGGGSIVNMSSTAALIGLGEYLAYSAAKGAIRSLTKSVAIHCRAKKYRIRCNSVHPGSISTPMVHAALESHIGMKLMDQPDPEATRLKLGIGEPNDVAYLVLYLLSDESKHVTGAELVVDNGDTVS